jgi:2-C-methyl-D-erythritol 4-phosphate cytidylyltransferase
VIVAAPETSVDEVRALLARQEFSADVSVVAGGDSRSESVARALIALPDDVDVVLVHDAARPLVPVEVVTGVASAVRDGHDAVIPVIPVVDTIKSLDDEGQILGTVPREQLRATQTPQGFRREVLQRAHAQVDSPVTDDAGMVESLGITVHAIAGHEEAFKVTTPLDFLLAESLIAKRRVR